MNIRIKTMISILFSVTLFVLSGCINTQNNHTIVYHNSIAKENTLAVLEAVLNKDASTIVELFCPYVKENYPDLKERVSEWMNCIDGEIISYDEPTWSLRIGETTNKQGIILQTISGRAKNVKTSTGRIYRVGYAGYSAYQEKPEYVGITNLVIFAEEVYIPEIGYFKEETYKLEFSEMWE